MSLGKWEESLQPAQFLQNLHDGQAATEHGGAERYDGILHRPHQQTGGNVSRNGKCGQMSPEIVF